MKDFKKCSRCGMVKPKEEYYIRKSKGREDVLWHCCKECWKAYKNNRYYTTPRNHINHYKNWFKKPKGRYGSYRYEAKRKGYLFTIEYDDFTAMTQSRCYYCGKEAKDNEKIGIDRVNNDLGYIIGNCVPCCSECNYVKRERSKKSFIEHCKRVTEYQNANSNLVKQGESRGGSYESKLHKQEGQVVSDEGACRSEELFR